jgi:hypothetical protein
MNSFNSRHIIASARPAGIHGIGVGSKKAGGVNVQVSVSQTVDDIDGPHVPAKSYQSDTMEMNGFGVKGSDV